jgi:signal transduction histidine kinase/CheY-like chemotaxis protein
MKLSRTIALGAAVVTALLVAALVMAAALLAPYADKADIHAANQRLDRASAFLAQDGQRLRTAAIARAQHDETYAWARGRDDAFYRKTMNPERMTALNTDALLIYTADLKLKAWAVAPHRTDADQIVAAMRDLPQHGKTAAGFKADGTLAGLAPGLGSLWQMAGAAITRSDGSGSGAGYLIMLREVDEEKMQLAGDLTGGVFTFQINTEDRPAGRYALAPRLLEGEVLLTRPLASFWGQEIGAISVQSPRAAAAMFDRAFYVHAAALAAAAMVAACIALMLLRHVLIAPLRRLINAVRAARESGQWAAPSAVARGDELGELARAFDVLMAENAARERELREKTAAAEAAAQAKADFLSTMSHEIRTPLNGVLSVARVLQKTELAPRQREMVDLIAASGVSLEHLLNDVLDLAKVEAGRLSIEAQAFDLKDALASVIALFETRADEKGLAFDVRGLERAAGLYEGDPVRLRQVLSNLLSNAVKFTERGGVTLAIDVDAPPDGPAALIMRVRDTGPGFDATTAARLFARFEQADASITRRFGGSGLGLAIARELAQLMGGDLTAEAIPGKGAEFTAWVRVKRLGDAEGGARVAAGGCEPVQIAGLKVLAADDNANNRQVLQLILEAAEMRLSLVCDGAEALEAAEAAAYDVILMDMQMPVMDGLSAIRAIRALEAETGRPATPIIAVSANAMAHQIETARAAGADGHVSKPIEPAKLMAAIGDVVRVRRVGQTAPQPAKARA